MSSASDGLPTALPARSRMLGFRPRPLAACTAVGSTVRVEGRLRINNQGILRIGDSVRFAGGSIPTEIDVQEGAVLDIGDGAVVEQGVRLTAHSRVWIGPRCRLAAFVTVRDDCTVEGPGPAPITVGEGVTLQERTLVLGGVAIGPGADLPSGSVVTADVPPLPLAEHRAAEEPAQDDLPAGQRSPSGPPDLSVVIPTRNRSPLLLDTLAALERQTAPLYRFEVIVVDDGSSDGTPQKLAALHTPLELRTIANGGTGAAAARNAGARAARGRALLFLDDDVLPAPTLVSGHLAQHYGTTPTVVIGLLMSDSQRQQPAWARWEADRLDHHYRAMGNGLRPAAGRRLYSGNFSVDRQLFLDCGGFDTRIARAEDVDLGYRLETAGARFVYCPEAAGVHRGLHDFAHWQAGAREYGRCDVILARDRGYGQGLTGLFAGFHSRHVLQRISTLLLVDRAVWLHGAVWLMSLLGRGAGQLGGKRVTRWAFSGIYNLRYWQGVRDEMGAADFWHWLEQTAPKKRAMEGREASG